MKNIKFALEIILLMRVYGGTQLQYAVSGDSEEYQSISTLSKQQKKAVDELSEKIKQIDSQDLVSSKQYKENERLEKTQREFVGLLSSMDIEFGDFHYIQIMQSKILLIMGANQEYKDTKDFLAFLSYENIEKNKEQIAINIHNISLI